MHPLIENDILTLYLQLKTTLKTTLICYRTYCQVCCLC